MSSKVRRSREHEARPLTAADCLKTKQEGACSKCGTVTNSAARPHAPYSRDFLLHMLTLLQHKSAAGGRIKPGAEQARKSRRSNLR